jgi:hypothetical protein
VIQTERGHAGAAPGKHAPRQIQDLVKPDRLEQELGSERELEGIAEGMRRNLPADLVQYFRACQSTHISIEEAGLHVTAARCLRASDRAALERGMQARRTRKYRFQ